MVTEKPLIDFIRSESGVSFTEALISFPIILLLVAISVDAGSILFHYNQAMKAVNLGVRKLATNSVVLSDADMANSRLFVATTDDLSGISVSCGFQTTPCKTDEINKLVYGSENGVPDTDCAFENKAGSGLCDYYNVINPQNIRVIYEALPLGFAERPNGAIVLITLELHNLSVKTQLFGKLLNIFNINMGPIRAAMISEDLTSCRENCVP